MDLKMKWLLMGCWWIVPVAHWNARAVSHTHTHRSLHPQRKTESRICMSRTCTRLPGPPGLPAATPPPPAASVPALPPPLPGVPL